MPAGTHLMNLATTIAAFVQFRLISRLQIDVGGNRFFGKMYGGARFEPDAQEQHVCRQIAHKSVGTVSRHRCVVEMMASEERRACGPQARNRMSRMDAAEIGVARSEHLCQHAGV